jgi:hypothetical protein
MDRGGAAMSEPPLARGPRRGSSQSHRMGACPLRQRSPLYLRPGCVARHGVCRCRQSVFGTEAGAKPASCSCWLVPAGHTSGPTPRMASTRTSHVSPPQSTTARATCRSSAGGGMPRTHSPVTRSFRVPTGVSAGVAGSAALSTEHAATTAATAIVRSVAIVSQVRALRAHAPRGGARWLPAVLVAATDARTAHSPGKARRHPSTPRRR